MLRTRMNGHDDVLERLVRLEKKLDMLIQALAEDVEEDDEPGFDLDGNPCGAARDPSEPLS